MADDVLAAPPAGGAAGRTRRMPPGPNFPEAVVEVDGPQGMHVLWFPTQERLRPRWDWTRLPRGSTSESGLAKMPTIPGMHIVVNAKERWARVIDPLGAKENAKLLTEVSAAYKAIFGFPVTAVPPVERRGMGDDDLATWLYWLWREHDAGRVRLVRGRVATLEEIADAMPQAKVRRKFFDSLAYRRRDGETAATAVRDEYVESYVGGDQQPPAA